MEKLVPDTHGSCPVETPTGGSAGIYVNMYSKDYDSIESKENQRVNSDCLAVGLHGAELQLTIVAR